MTNWKKQIEYALKFTKDKFEDLETTLTLEELEIEFDGGYGGEEGKPFTAWSKDYVYFPVSYDGAEWVGYVSRNPNGKPTKHIGG